MCFQVQLLTGIGRYREMLFVFEALVDNHKLDLVLRRSVTKVIGLTFQVGFAKVPLISRMFPYAVHTGVSIPQMLSCFSCWYVVVLCLNFVEFLVGAMSVLFA